MMSQGKGGEEKKVWGEGIKVMMKKLKGGGKKVNIRGDEVEKNEKKKEEEVKIMEYMV